MVPLPTVVVPTVPVSGTADRFPVRRIWCVGQNYADHAREMGGDPDRAPPFFFAKPADAAVPDGGDLPFPPATADLHHEVELVVAIGRSGRDLDPADVLDHVWGYAIGLDMTRRDLQAEAKRAGRPWALAKGFDQSCPIGPIHPASRIGHPSRGAITLSVDGVPRQQGDLSDMIWSVAEALSFLSRFVTLEPGDLLMTGTPSGVGPVRPGERVVGSCDALPEPGNSVAVRYLSPGP
ncbi:MAG: fumarylacetoacetate hydrolase family protein [Gluconacetobacter diazotrophicus]|nr:fumarylacetoacetate hydrolase family protein [Gluconacetobacter diazotrophicus]